MTNAETELYIAEEIACDAFSGKNKFGTAASLYGSIADSVISGEYASASQREVSGIESAADIAASEKQTAAPPKDKDIANSKYAVGRTADNRHFIIIEEDILKNVPRRNWAKTVISNLKNRFPNGITVAGNIIKTNSKTIGKLVNNDGNKYNKKILSDKYRATNNLDEILIHTDNWIGEETRHNSFKEFARGQILLRVGKNDYSAEIVAGTNGHNETVMYDIVNMTPTTITEKNPTQLRRFISEKKEYRQQYPKKETAGVESDSADIISDDLKIVNNDEKKISTLDKNAVQYALAVAGNENGMLKKASDEFKAKERHAVSDEAENKKTANSKIAVGRAADKAVFAKYSVPDEYQKAGEEVADFIKKVMAMKDRGARARRKHKIEIITEAHKEMVEKIVRQINPDFSTDGYELWINGSGAEHIEIEHGENGSTDHTMALREDKMLIPWAANSPDRGRLALKSDGLDLSYGFANSDNSPSLKVILEKDLDDSTFYVAECVPDSKGKKIYIISAYQSKKSSTNQVMNITSEEVPHPTPETPHGNHATTDSIAPISENVNNDEKKISTLDKNAIRYALAVAGNENGMLKKASDEFKAKERHSVSDEAEGKESEEAPKKRRETAAEKEERKRRANALHLGSSPNAKKIPKSEPFTSKYQFEDSLLNIFRKIPGEKRLDARKYIREQSDKFMLRGRISERDKLPYFFTIHYYLLLPKILPN